MTVYLPQLACELLFFSSCCIEVILRRQLDSSAQYESFHGKLLRIRSPIFARIARGHFTLTLCLISFLLTCFLPLTYYECFTICLLYVPVWDSEMANIGSMLKQTYKQMFRRSCMDTRGIVQKFFILQLIIMFYGELLVFAFLSQRCFSATVFKHNAPQYPVSD